MPRQVWHGRRPMPHQLTCDLSLAIATVVLRIDNSLGDTRGSVHPLLAAQRVVVVGDPVAYDGAWIANLVGWMEREGLSAHVIDLRLPAVAAGASPEPIAPADNAAAFLPEVTARLELLRAA